MTALPLIVFALSGQPQTPALRALEQDLAELERAELREVPGRFVPPDRPWLTQARERLGAHLQSTPDDATALVLFARVGRFALMGARVAECSPEHGCVLDSTYDDAPYHAALDRALAQRQDDPAAHFWKARLLADGRPVLRNGEFALDVDTARLLSHAQRAVQLDPHSIRYREFLAVTLTDMGRFQEAAALVRDLDRGKHPLHLILQDLNGVPVPEGSVPWPGHAVFAAVGMNENPPRFAAQTGRSWLVPVSRDELESFYRRRWPQFKLYSGPPEGGDSQIVESTVRFQYFEPDARGRLQPARDSSFLARLERTDRFSGVVMVVRDIAPGSEAISDRYRLEVMLVTGRKGP